MGKRLNWEIILYNIVEAREQLQEVESRAKDDKSVGEVELSIMLEHAYFHLNFAWNVRHEKTKHYENLTDDNFNKWSKFPKEMKPYKVPKKKNAHKAK